MPIEEITCDFCKKPIKNRDLIKVESVDHNCKNTGEIIKYFHYPYKKTKYYNQGGCYIAWSKSEDHFIPHSVMTVSRKEILAV